MACPPPAPIACRDYEYDEYVDDPEGFVYEEHLARECSSLRKFAQRCLLTLADTAECRASDSRSWLSLEERCGACQLLLAIGTSPGSIFKTFGLFRRSSPASAELSS